MPGNLLPTEVTQEVVMCRRGSPATPWLTKVTKAIAPG
jgi:hypothetical protein